MANRVIQEDRIGAVGLGDTLDQLEQKYAVQESEFPYSEQLGYAISQCDDDDVVVFQADESGTVISIFTASPQFLTENGGRVGMKLSQLISLYPDGVISTGVEEGGWIAFRPHSLSEYFEFDLKNTEIECLRDYQNCSPDFYDRVAIGYWVLG